MKVHELPKQVQDALVDLVDNGFFDDDAWQSFYNDDVENVKKHIIECNGGMDLFTVFNDTDGFFASFDELTLDKAIEFITEFPKRYESQNGMYRTGNRDLIPATEVKLSINYTASIEPEEDYPHYIS